MTKVLLALCAVAGAILGTIAGSDHAGREHARGEVAAAAEELSRSQQLHVEIDRLRARLDDVQRDLDAARTPAAATAAREKLFQLRVDMVAVEDAIAVLARRGAVARDF